MSIVIGSIIALMGFIIWDRRTAISPVVKKAKELEDRSDRRGAIQDKQGA